MTVDDYIMRELKEVAYRSGLPLKQVVNRALRAGLEQLCRRSAPRLYRCKTYSMGSAPRSNLEKALEIASSLEDEEIRRKLSLRK